MPSRLFRTAVIAVLVTTLAACGGWYPRGTKQNLDGIRRAQVIYSSAPRLGVAVLQELVYNGVGIVGKGAKGTVIELSEEEFDRRVLSVDPDTGKVREIELGLEIRFSVRTHDGKLVVPPERLTWTQDFIFDEGSLLGTTEQELVIERELAEDAARTILLRLETIELPPS